MVCLAESRRDYRNAQFSSKAAFHNSEASIFYWTGGAIALRELYEELPRRMRAAAALRTDGTILRGD